MFTAFANALGGDSNGTSARRAAVYWARAHPEVFRHFFDEGETFRQYLARMVKPREYGDYHMLQALCGAYNVSVAVYKKTEVNAINAGEYVWMVAGDEGEDVPRLAMFLEGEHYENLVTFEEVWRM